MKFIFCLFFIFLQNCASSIDFLPDPNFNEENPFYKKKTYQEIELIKERPTKEFKYVGMVILRNFISPEKNSEELEVLKKEMFRLKIDGVYIKSNSIEEVAPFVITSKSQDGMLLGYQETNKEMGRVVGYPFRYKAR